MSDELTGKDGVEEGIGGRQPLPEWNPAPKDEAKTYEGTTAAIEAGNDLTNERGALTELPLVEIKDKRQREDDRRFYTSAQEAAHDLSTYHQVENATQAAENLNELAAGVDRARAWAAGAEQPQPDAQQPATPSSDATAQPDAPQAEASAEAPIDGIDPEVSKALSNPKVRAAIEAAVAPVEQARQQYTAATAQIANMLVAELVADLPEIASLPPEQRGVGLHLRQQQPERFAAFEARVGRIQQVVAAQQQNNAVAEQQQQAQLRSWAAEQDAVFSNATRGESRETLQAAAKEIVDFATGNGLSREALGQLWATNPVLRSSAFQSLMLDAAKFRMAQRTATANPARANVPPVMRPGISASAGERANVDLSELRNQFRKATGQEQLRLGARLQAAQRRARG